MHDASPPAGGTRGVAYARVSRRRFLAGLGALIGMSSLPPLLRHLDRTRHPVAIEVTRVALGSWMRVLARHADPERAKRAVEAAFAAVRRVDRLMSVHRPDSQLSAVNAAAGRNVVHVDRDVLRVVERARSAGQASGGVYDVTVLPLMRLYGHYGRDRSRMPSDREIASALDASGNECIAIDPRAGTLGLTRTGAGLDLGSIGKGWALDRAVDAMREEGIESGLVDLGGNVYGIGTPGDGSPGWSVGLFHPTEGSLERVFVLRDASVATSGNSEQSRLIGAVRVGHLFDARSGRPSDGHASASVVAATGVDADVLSTVAFLRGPSGIAAEPAVLESHFAG